MHSTLVRSQNVFGFFTTVAFIVAALIAATDLITPRAPTAKIEVGNIQVYVFPILDPHFGQCLPSADQLADCRS
jgi:hypothetical protein